MSCLPQRYRQFNRVYKCQGSPLIMNNESQRGYGHHGLFIVGPGHLKTVIINIIQLWLFWFPPSKGLSGKRPSKHFSLSCLTTQRTPTENKSTFLWIWEQLIFYGDTLPPGLQRQEEIYNQVSMASWQMTQIFKVIILTTIVSSTFRI